MQEASIQGEKRPICKRKKKLIKKKKQARAGCHPLFVFT